MFSKGADVDALRDSAGRMAAYGREVDVVRLHGQRAVSTMQRAWQGPDLQHLVERWRRVEHDLHRISAELARLGQRLHDNADLQHRSSGTSAGGGSHHASGGAGVQPLTGHGGGGGAGHTGHAGTSGVAAAAVVVGAGGHGSVAHVGVHEAAFAVSNGGRPHVAPAGWADALVGWGPDGGRPVVTAGVPQPLHAMGWGQWIGSTHGGSAFAVVDPAHGPFVPAGVAAAAAHHLGLPIR
ncbi:WXG100 family type VII secretion target [Terrabacter sp. C0L_2]|uniref:WXG100 family type VII secretion target n=1 Tax=Terrabacter sp. C0L_2 TaxID=3108389 RepID=UPI002ED05F9B|nr:hypothetical protein U5C87_10060 [Terrabacter sp. C0L_2]